MGTPVIRSKIFSRFERMGRAWMFCVAEQVDIAVDLGVDLAVGHQ
jgi:hypothetical protein